MTQGRARRLLTLLTVVFAVAVTWPGVLLANRFRPVLFGLPFSMVWVAGWIVAGLVVLLLLDRALYGGSRDKDRGAR